jgi:AmmeMemoRadiSam system protein B
MLAALRRDLDIMPSPAADRPGLLIRDPMRYSDAVVILPWALAPCLELFDGEHSALDLRAELVRIAGHLDTTQLCDQLHAALRDSAFLDDETFAQRKQERERRFAEAPVRTAAQAGGGYPDELNALRETMNGYLDASDSPTQANDVMAIAAPHVSPFGGWQSYRAAYRMLPRRARERTFIILGTSHYGEPEKFGLTRKPFETPLGRTQIDLTMIDRLASRAASGVTVEDYCHSVEHSIEFQVLFLQWLYGPDIRIVPILCGAFVQSIYGRGMPEDDEGVARVLGELGEIAAAESERVAWVLGVDMAHIGRRYGDRVSARANEGHLAEVASRDAARNEQIAAGNASGFWDLVQQNRDDLRWCGSAPIYTFLKAVPQARGQVHRYEQWNIDEASVVTFAGISFTAA